MRLIKEYIAKLGTCGIKRTLTYMRKNNIRLIKEYIAQTWNIWYQNNFNLHEKKTKE